MILFVAAKLLYFFEICKLICTFSFKAQVGSDASEIVFGEGGEGTEIIDRVETDPLSAKGINVFGLVVTEIGMTLQTVYAAAVDADGKDSRCVHGEMV